MRLRRSALNALSWLGYSNARGRMDRRIAALFDGMRGGVFVEAGAADGLDQSNTLYLERRLGWTGLLVEPVREQAEHCRRVRRGAIVERCALGPFARSGETLTVRKDGLTSTVTESRAGPPSESDGPAGRTVSEEPVPCVALGALLDRHGMHDIDILSLDVEGGEIFVLDGLDFDRVRIRYLLVETFDLPRLERRLAGRFVPAGQWGKDDYLFRSVNEPRN